MSKVGVYDYYKGLPPWAKGVVIVGGSAVAVLIGMKVYNALFPSDIAKKNRAILDNINSDISAAQAAGIRPTYSDSQYLIYANEIYDGMRYCVGDDYNKVEANLKLMKNDIDVAKLIKAFGTRQAYCFGLDSGSPKDLFTFVASELGNEYLGLTSYRVTSINDDWTTKGIKYKI